LKQDGGEKAEAEIRREERRGNEWIARRESEGRGRVRVRERC
jgi:hypothetical protein